MKKDNPAVEYITTPQYFYEEGLRRFKLQKVFDYDARACYFRIAYDLCTERSEYPDFFCDMCITLADDQFRPYFNGIEKLYEFWGKDFSFHDCWIKNFIYDRMAATITLDLVDPDADYDNPKQFASSVKRNRLPMNMLPISAVPIAPAENSK